ncbi:MAG: addiction module toxin, HicA family [Alphaproteobacteria bacterium 16-39-46]|nr:MAG: addiction module toxin, HicA family [Alphaproteobacteria bacterium 16-39-46]OZA43877.1 MAG: addiction module toxin, HicA family [Alphaproteobacteria bacterium 17-39-52]HQS84090.1 type II toxin-antitoxin system HicA family toxin [Alphaproteobacteria bacterium]HQS93964.1 type II toxin-antitoxin system HicA family toxin [Alphaproteobacteria bacterium]
MDSKEIIKILKKDGWVLKRTRGSHHHFCHPTRKGLVTVPHPKMDIPIGTLKSIEKQLGIQFERGVKK